MHKVQTHTCLVIVLCVIVSFASEDTISTKKDIKLSHMIVLHKICTPLTSAEHIQYTNTVSFEHLLLRTKTYSM